MTGTIIPTINVLPEKFTINGFDTNEDNWIKDITPWKAFGCVAIGLWSGCVIGYITEYYTSNAYKHV
jgi:inorganic pyrophosphatase